MRANDQIHHNFQTGKISNARWHEFIGLKLMALAGLLTSPVAYVGYSWIARFIRLLLPSKRTVVSTILNDTKFSYPYADLYWSRLAYNKDTYDRHVEGFLRAMSHVEYAYLDCGANYGYMSAIISSKEYGGKPAIAIEADPDTFERLTYNAQLNDNRFEVRNNAIFTKRGETVNIYGDKHEARSMIAEGGEKPRGIVTTLAIDDLWDWVAEKHKTASILKLDVEGVEIDAMKGAHRILELDCLVLYEDHASDKTNEVTDYVMNKLGLRTFHAKDGHCREITDINEITKIKTNPKRGYDFIATKSDMWLSEIKKY